MLGVVAGLILLIGGYAIWRGPHRAFIPPRISKKFRRNIVDEKDYMGEKKLPDGQTGVDSGATRIQRPRPAKRPRRERVKEKEGTRLSRADLFKREVVAARQRGSVEWVGTTGGAGPAGADKESAVQGGGRTPMSDSGTLVGSVKGPDGREQSYLPCLPYDRCPDSPSTPVLQNRPARRSSLMPQQGAALMTSTHANNTSPAITEEVDDNSYAPSPVTRPQRASIRQSYVHPRQPMPGKQAQRNLFENDMKEEEDSVVW